MSTIFHEDTTAPGTMVPVTAVQSSNPRGLLLSGGIGTADGTAGIITALETSQQVAAQFQQSLDQSVYALSFGDAVGQMTASLLLNRACDGADRVASFFSYYSANRITPDNNTPTSWQIGTSSFTGFVTGFQMSASSSDFLLVGRLTFAAWLDTAGGSSVGGGGGLNVGNNVSNNQFNQFKLS